MKKQTIIMLHGFRGTHHGLRLIAQQLTMFKVVVPDLPGFGRGESLDTYALNSYVAWLREFVVSHDFDGLPILLGHSFGTIVAAAYAAKYPHSIKKLILVNPIGAPALEGPHAFMSQIGVLYYWVGKRLPARIAHKWLSARFMTFAITVAMTKTKDKELRGFIHKEHNRHFSDFHTASSVAQGFATSISHNVRDFAAKIPVPTLLIAGDLDDITPLAKQHELQKLFPNARIDVIEDVGHLTHYETPAAVAGLIQAFVKRS